MELDAIVEAWVADLGDQLAVSASAVQDRLLDLWGLLPEGETRRTIENWLTETLHRELYTSADITDRLRQLGELETVG
ncbi:MAG TPA: hypothetical protein VLL25_03180 [Acidimicrobiales bacterium]|nr:hypothetical protein [Acidimicrobiales bacterium]